MSITIGSLTFSRLTAQPFGFEETETRDGLTARKWRVTGLATNTEWSNLLSVYEAWRDLRIQDPDSLASDSVGNTVALTATANGLTWSGVACWFTQAPAGEQIGAYVQVTAELVDANEALEVLKRQKEKQKTTEDLPNLGTFTIGSAVVTLTKPPETFTDVPQMQLTAAGGTYVSGPLGATVVREVEGTTDAAGWAAIQSWFATTTAATPTVGAYFPLSAPQATATNEVVDGVKVVQYAVQLSLGVVR